MSNQRVLARPDVVKAEKKLIEARAAFKAAHPGVSQREAKRRHEPLMAAVDDAYADKQNLVRSHLKYEHRREQREIIASHHRAKLDSSLGALASSRSGLAAGAESSTAAGSSSRGVMRVPTFEDSVMGRFLADNVIGQSGEDQRVEALMLCSGMQINARMLHQVARALAKDDSDRNKKKLIEQLQEHEQRDLKTAAAGSTQGQSLSDDASLKLRAAQEDTVAALTGWLGMPRSQLLVNMCDSALFAFSVRSNEGEDGDDKLASDAVPPSAAAVKKQQAQPRETATLPKRKWQTAAPQPRKKRETSSNYESDGKAEDDLAISETEAKLSDSAGSSNEHASHAEEPSHRSSGDDLSPTA